MADKNTMRMLEDTANDMLIQADNIHNNIKRRRVTHTQLGMRRLINYVAQIMKFLDTDKTYGVRLENMLFQCQGGPLEVTRQKDLIYIQGVMRIDALREFIIVNEPPNFKALEVAEKGK